MNLPKEVMFNNFLKNSYFKFPSLLLLNKLLFMCMQNLKNDMETTFKVRDISQ